MVNMWTIGPLEIVRSPPWETWGATWHRPGTAEHGVWMYRWAICSPWLTLRWISAEYRAKWTRGGGKETGEP